MKRIEEVTAGLKNRAGKMKRGSIKNIRSKALSKHEGLNADSKISTKNKMASSLNKKLSDTPQMNKRQVELKLKTDKLHQQLNNDEKDFNDLLKLLKRFVNKNFV